MSDLGFRYVATTSAGMPDPRDHVRWDAERWKPHPPILRALGTRRKITLGPWFRPAYRVLREMRRLRGTMFDPFGHAAVRRVEP